MATNEPNKPNTKSPSTNPITNILLLSSSAFQQTPFLRLNKPTPNTIHEFHQSIVSKSTQLFDFLQSLASQNPIIQKTLSLSTSFRDFHHEVRSRNNVRVSMSNYGFAAVLPGDSVAGMVVANGLLNFFNIYNTLLVARLVLTWFPNSPPAIVNPLSTICDPYLNIFRGVIPPLGGLDLSPILAFLVLNAFTSTAAALPCELPLATAEPSSSSQRKWIKRLCSSKTSPMNPTKGHP